MTRNALQIKTNGETKVLDLDAPEGSLKVLQNGVGGYIECVTLPEFGCEMYVNEEGLYECPEQNLFATALFMQQYNHVNVIMGDVVFVGPVDREGNSTGLTDSLTDAIRATAVRFYQD